MWKRVAAIAIVLIAVIALALTRIDGERTLNSNAWMDYGTVVTTDGQVISYAGDRGAIDWLNENVKGSPVIAEMIVVWPKHYGGAYVCGGARISRATGLPTVLGWDRHEAQQRPTTDFQQRERDNRSLYLSRDPAEKLRVIRAYNIEYVISGPLEAIYPITSGDNDCIGTGDPLGITAFDVMVGTSLEVVFSEQGTTIYHVLPPA